MIGEAQNSEGIYGQVSRNILCFLNLSGDLKQLVLLPSIAPKSASAARLYEKLCTCQYKQCSEYWEKCGDTACGYVISAGSTNSRGRIS